MLGSRINLLAKTLIFSAIFWAIQVSAANAATAANVSDEHIRQIVEGLLKEKDQKIEQLEARIQQLEHSPQSVTFSPPPLQANTSAASTVKASEKAPVATGKVTENVAEPAITSKLGAITEEIEELREAAKEKGLDISGFFDVNAKTDNSTDQTFSVGSVELDLEYAYNDHFAASSALVLCGNSSGTDYSAPAAITPVVVVDRAVLVPVVRALPLLWLITTCLMIPFRPEAEFLMPMVFTFKVDVLIYRFLQIINTSPTLIA